MNAKFVEMKLNQGRNIFQSVHVKILLLIQVEVGLRFQIMKNSRFSKSKTGENKGRGRIYLIPYLKF